MSVLYWPLWLLIILLIIEIQWHLQLYALFMFSSIITFSSTHKAVWREYFGQVLF